MRRWGLFARGVIALVVAGVLLAGSAGQHSIGPGWWEHETDSGRVHAQAPRLHYSALYFPWIPNGEATGETGPWFGSITIQNLVMPEAEERSAIIFVLSERWIWSLANDPAVDLDSVLAGMESGSLRLGSGEMAPRFHLGPNASQTLTPDLLGIGEEEAGSGLVVLGVFRDNWEYYQDIGEVRDQRAPVLAGLARQVSPVPMSSGTRTGDAHLIVDGYTAIPLADVAWGPQSDFCHDLAGTFDACDSSGFYRLDREGFDGFSYLPIVQTNGAWNTRLYLTNVDVTTTTAANVDVTLIRSEETGQTGPGADRWSETLAVPPGGTRVIDLAAVVGDEWVGSAEIAAEVGIVAAAYRENATDQMLMINTAAPSLWARTGESPFLPQEVMSMGTTGDDASSADLQQTNGDPGYLQYAPLIFRHFEGWNTGISFVNIAEQTNTIWVRFVNQHGTQVGFDQVTISPGGQRYLYLPGTGDLGIGSGYVGAAVFEGVLPFHVAIDQVKYETGEAMSYLATASGASADEDAAWPSSGEAGVLAMPLVQKGWQDGTGDTSGIQLLNVHRGAAVTVEVQFYSGSGGAVAPTRTVPLRRTLGPGASTTIYTMHLQEMAQGQRASVVVRPVSGEGVVVGVSNMVNYGVGNDGSAAYPLANQHGQYRFPRPQSQVPIGQ